MTSVLKLLCLCCMCFVVNGSTFPSLPTTVTLDRVRRCTFRLFNICMNTGVTREEYKVFGKKGMGIVNQKRVYLSKYNEPKKEDVENIIFAVAGQQFRPQIAGLYGDASGITGQPEDYSKTYNDTDGSKYIKIDPYNIPNAVIKSGVFPIKKTFVVSVFDARFNFEYFESVKQEYEDGYYAYLDSKITKKVKTIYLVGHSRGGCLVYRLAARLSKNYKNMKVIVHSFDGVCTTPAVFNGIPMNQYEFGITDLKYPNPLNPDYFVFTADMNTQFTHKDCLSVRSFISGAPIISEILGVRAFGHIDFSGLPNRTESIMHNGFPFYVQSFEKEKHGPIMYKHHDEAVSALRYAINSLPDKCRS